MIYAVSYGNGNDGLSRLHADFTVEAPEGSEYLIAKLAALTGFPASRRFITANVETFEMGENAAQACVLNPPRSPEWSDANGAWKLVEAYPAEEITNDPVHHDSLEACFGAALVRAHKDK